MRPPELKHLPCKRKLKLVPVDDLPRADRRRFVEGLGLVPLSKARVMKKHQNRNREIEITKLDDNDTDSQTTLKSPTTPKTPRSLMSQLSRDLSPPSVKNKRKSLMAAFDEEPEDVEQVTSKGLSDQEVSPTEERKETKEREDKDLIKKTSLLTIDLCSSLGQRVKKLMNEQAKVLITSLLEEEQQPYEEFCHTPKKTGMMARLRNRPVDFPVTFRKSRKTLPKYAHQFKFKTSQRKEWYLTTLTGLNAKSRKLKKLVKKCSVSITRLPKKEIEKWATRRKTNYYVNISRLSDLQQPTVSNSTSQQHQMLENLLMHARANTSVNVQKKPPGFLQLNQGQKLTVLKRSPVALTQNMLGNRGGNVVDLTPPSTPESAKGPRPIQLLAKSPEQARMLQQLLQRPLQNRLPAYVSPVKNTSCPVTGNNNNTATTSTTSSKKGSQISRGKKRILDEDDIICLSSDEESDSHRSSQPPPAKYQKTEASRKGSPTLLFKCHLCHTELTCYGSFSNYIEKHFSDKHNVNNIQLVEHLDSRGQKVVSIVEKAVKKAPVTSDKTKLTSKKPQSNTALNNAKQNSTVSSKHANQQKTLTKNEAVASAKSKSPQSVKTSSGPQRKSLQTSTNSVGRRRSNRGNGTSEVICID